MKANTLICFNWSSPQKFMLAAALAQMLKPSTRSALPRGAMPAKPAAAKPFTLLGKQGGGPGSPEGQA